MIFPMARGGDDMAKKILKAIAKIAITVIFE